MYLEPAVVRLLSPTDTALPRGTEASSSLYLRFFGAILKTTKDLRYGRKADLREGQQLSHQLKLSLVSNIELIKMSCNIRQKGQIKQLIIVVEFEKGLASHLQLHFEDRRIFAGPAASGLHSDTTHRSRPTHFSLKKGFPPRAPSRNGVRNGRDGRYSSAGRMQR